MKAVILAGGSGTRLFPLSTENKPKQFLSIDGNESMFQKTVKRCLLINRQRYDDLVIVTNESYKSTVIQQLESISPLFRNFRNIILEPVGRNTAPAIALSVKFLLENMDVSEEEILFISPADHIIHPEDKFANYVKEALRIAEEGYIVTFGIRPTKPETGYGYIELDRSTGSRELYNVKDFHEKPDYETAKKYLMSGKYLWNSGMFVFSISTILEEFKKHAPEIYSTIKNWTYKDMLSSFHLMPDISIDYAVMEKTDKTVVMPLDIIWSDVGSWDALYEIMPKDQNGNIKIGKVVDIDTKGSLIIENSGGKVIATVGLEDVIIVETEEVLLVLRKGMGQKVKEIVKKIEKSLKQGFGDSA